jgi:hypothetical protein
MNPSYSDDFVGTLGTHAHGLLMNLDKCIKPDKAVQDLLKNLMKPYKVLQGLIKRGKATGKKPQVGEATSGSRLALG